MAQTDQEILQKNLVQFLVKDVFNTISEEDILKVLAPNVWEHRGKKLTEGQVKALRAEATAFSESGLWKILKAELLWHAHEKGFRKSKTEGDQIAGKLLEYFTDIVESRLKKMIII